MDMKARNRMAVRQAQETKDYLEANRAMIATGSELTKRVLVEAEALRNLNVFEGDLRGAVDSLAELANELSVLDGESFMAAKAAYLECVKAGNLKSILAGVAVLTMASENWRLKNFVGREESLAILLEKLQKD